MTRPDSERLPAAIAVEPARQDAVERLLRLGEDFALSLYPAEECFMLPLSDLEKPGVTVFVARVDGEAVGMAALVGKADGSAELKRLFVEDRARGRGLAAGLLERVEAHAGETGVRVIQLETGTRSDAAIALYEKRGFAHIPPFGEYIGSASSVCMEKVL
jgi:putative acetyltransferase